METELFWVCFYIALAIFVIGLVWRFSLWFRRDLAGKAEGASPCRRLAASFGAAFRAIFSRQFGCLVAVLFWDGLLQRRLFRESKGRWLTHIFIYGGFVGLLLMHAMDGAITEEIFPGYASTVNPYLFLRNAFGVLAIIGIIMAIRRRAGRPEVKRSARPADALIIILLAALMVSGFLLEGSKIVSHVSFNEMVELYADFEGEPELSQLKSYWAEEHDVVFPPGEAKTEAEVIEAGRELHESSCLACHSKPAWGFISYGLAKALKPAAVGLSESRFGLILWRIHFILLFACWALLPFSKFLHVLTTPVNLIVNRETESASSNPAVTATKQALAMDACTHCGECSARCSVAVSFGQIGNDNILPSEKLAALRRLLDGRGKDSRRLKALAEGAEICTLCGRCTTLCPAGIGLQELWLALKEELAARGVPTPFVAAREETVARYGGDGRGQPQPLPPVDGPAGLGYVHQPETFVNCFECQTCTNVCPVVANYDNPGEKLGFLPHQLMHSLSLGLSDMALGSRMVWDCVTCYQCQEQCPQGVDVTDTLYELKNLAFVRLKEAES